MLRKRAAQHACYARRSAARRDERSEIIDHSELHGHQLMAGCLSCTRQADGREHLDVVAAGAVCDSSQRQTDFQYFSAALAFWIA